jgi:CheY-like chemotaxis protein
LQAIEANRPDLALVDIQLARGASGFEVAAALQALKIPCLFMTGNVPARPRPDLTLGVLAKPFSDDAFFAALDVASKVIAGDEPVPTTLPPELNLY